MTTRPAPRLLATSDIASANGAAVLRLLSSHGPMARADLAREMGSNRAALGPVVGRLRDAGILVEVKGTGDRGVGKPKVPLWFSAEGCVAGSVAIRPSEVEIAVINLRGEVLARDGFSIRSDITGRDLGQRIGARAAEVLAPWRAAALGIGLSVPGLCDPGTGEILASTHLPEIVGDELGLAVQEALDQPITLEVDARALARAESWFGIGREVGSFVCLLTGRGLGAGIVVDRQVFSGDGRFDSEVGHMHIAIAGELCACGLVGCWETIATDRWIRREAATRGIALDPGISPSLGLSKAAGGAAAELLTSYAEHLALGISNVIHVLGMSTVVIEGDVADLDDGFFGVLAGEVGQRLLPSIMARSRLVRSSLGPLAELLAGGATAIDAALAIGI